MTKGWSWMLWAAAAYNWVVALPGVANASAAVNDRIVALLVCCFGVVYAITARDPARFAPMLWAGIIGKAGIVALLLPAVQAGTAAPGTGLVLAGDALFTVGFLALLFTARRNAA